MQLMTKEIAAKLVANDALVIKDGECPPEVIVKYFNPGGAQTWYIISGTPLDSINGSPTSVDKAKDWHLFGRCDLHGDGGELGYVLLSELDSARFPPLGNTVERDLHLPDGLTIHNYARYL